LNVSRGPHGTAFEDFADQSRRILNLSHITLKT
jgi:hypothetical protein